MITESCLFILSKHLYPNNQDYLQIESITKFYNQDVKNRKQKKYYVFIKESNEDKTNQYPHIPCHFIMQQQL